MGAASEGAVPRHELDQLLHRPRREIGAILARREVHRLTAERGQLSRRPVDLAGEEVVIPVETRVQVLRRLVGLEVEAPVQVERGRLEPVALTERVGEPAERVARRVDADEVVALAGGPDVAQRIGWLGDRSPLDPLGRLRRLVVEEERVVGDEPSLVAQLGEERSDPGVIDGALAGERDAACHVSTAFDQIDGQSPLLDGAGLADVVVVQSDEVGLLAGHVGEQDLVADEGGRRRGDELVEVRLVVGARTVGAARAVRGTHSSPPNTSTSANRHAGDACPVPTIWLSSPLPQFGVPITVKLSALATPRRLRQKVREIPR